ncbi:TPA: hypothetical protein DCP76_01715 [Patescibacteria group bacterium]|nr:hypothetical protein [Patescibacteria group bacterium]
MLNKALFLDFKEGDIEQKYFDRLTKLFNTYELSSKDNPKFFDSLKDTDVILAKMGAVVDREIIDAAPNLKFITIPSTGFSSIDISHAREKNITVSNIGGYSTESVAEFFFAVLFAQVRELEKAREQVKNEDYSYDKFMGTDLCGKTLGVVGAGRIGSRIIEIGLGLGMKVIYSSRSNKPELDAKGAVKKELVEVLSQSDVVTLRLALNSETQGMISKEKIALLKKGCIFVSLVPPQIVDQEAVMERAKNGDITFIFDHSDDIDSALAKRFLDTPNCIVYPPVAFKTFEANMTKWETFISNIEMFEKGTPQNVVN